MDAVARLNEFIRIAFGGKRSAAEEAMRIKRTGLAKYLRGEQHPGKVLLDKLAEVGANPLWIQRGEGSMYADNAAGRALRERIEGPAKKQKPARKQKDPLVLEPHPDGYRIKSMPTKVLVPVFLVPSGAGQGQPADDHVERWLDLENYIAPNPLHTFVVKAKGESMMYDGIRDGDMLVIDSSVRPYNFRVVVASLNGQLIVKRLEVLGRIARLMPANDEFEPIRLLASDKFEVWGVVVKIIHDPC